MEQEELETPKITAKAAEPTKFLQLALSDSGKNSVQKFLDPDCDPDQHSNQMVCC